MKRRFVLLVFLLPALVIYSQKVKIQEGNIKLLSEVDEYNVVFEYSNLEIPNYNSEEEFLEDKMTKREEKLKGDGERFKKSWFADRQNLYEPYFIKYFNDYFIMKRKIKVSKNNLSAKYTILVKTKMIYPGYNVVVAWEGAKLNAIISVYQTGSPNKVLFLTKTVNIQGKPSYNAGVRIANTYGILGRAFAGYLRRKT